MTRQRHSQSSLVTLVLLASSVLGSACAVGSDGRPVMKRIGDQVAFVGAQLQIKLDATDANGDPLYYDFRSDVPDLCRPSGCRAGIETDDEGKGLFTWTPRQEDIGIWTIEFKVTDGEFVVTESVRLEVRSSVGYNGLPRFIQPLGTGTTLDLGKRECFEFDIVIDDPDSRAVDIVELEPTIEGAELTVVDDFTATWRWCPTQEQIRAGGHHRLKLSAGDGTNPATEKSYLLVMRSPAKPDCPGAPPAIRHMPVDWTQPSHVRIVADVTDDMGVKHAPLLYYSTSDPGETPDLSRLTQISMTRVEGNSEAATYEALVPNPTATLPEGASAPLYYVIVVTDNDDGGGTCDHTTQLPARGAFSIEASTATAGGGGTPMGAGICEPCTTNRQCGGAGDLCVRQGRGAESFCLSACERDADCGDGYHCSDTEIESVDGTRGRQCIPEAGACDAPPPDPGGGGGVAGCADDSREDNDSRRAAEGKPALSPGDQSGLVMCTTADGSDDDWFKIEVSSESQIEAVLNGDSAHETDLDLAIYTASGEMLAVSESLRSDEEIATCVPAGTYYLRVYAFGEVRHEYSLSWSRRSATCDRSIMCLPDRSEPDDGVRNARRVDFVRGFESTDNTICGGNDDWYKMTIAAGQTMAVQLTFIQTRATEDLDIKFYLEQGGELIDQTPCSEEDPTPCTAFQGQSVDSDEYYDYTAEVAGTYYLVVHGWMGSENSYDIRFWELHL